MNKRLRIIFMGTPEFAIPGLEALMKSRHEVIAVVTAPDRPAGRGLKLRQPAVKEYAVKNNLLVLQPEKLKEDGFINKLKELEPDLFVVVAFRMLPEIIWKLPKKGTINLHASLLPQYRGAAPINWTIINGERETGITTFFLNENIDTGDIIFQQRVPISEDDTAGTLHDKLMKEGASLLVKTVDAIADDAVQRINQLSILKANLKPAPKIFREDCQINWNLNADKVYDFIRGLSPYPGAWSVFKSTESSHIVSIKIFKALKQSQPGLPAGTIAVLNKEHLYIGCADGCMEILELQPEGRKAMAATDFLRGHLLKNTHWKVAGT